MAGGFSDEDLNRVREASDLVTLFSEYVPLKQRGRDFWCCCPFHQEKSPSCKIDPSTQLWHCFGCGEGGDVFSFVMKHDGVSFPDAVRTLADRAHIQLSSEPSTQRVGDSKKARLLEICKKSAEFYHLQLMRNPATEAAEARSYLAGRNLGGKVPAKWDLGFAPGRQQLVNHLRSLGFSYEDMIEANVATTSRDGKIRDRFYNRIMFPIADVSGSVIAFGGRVVGKGEPKYLNSQETPLFHKSRVLYGLDKAKDAMTSTGVALITEGYTDVIALHESGVKNAVATLGTALTISHIRLISRYASKRIVYLFDGDAAGQRAADRALQFIDESITPEAGRTRIELYAVTLPDDLDPADFVAQRGADELKNLIEKAQPLLEYGIERRLSRYDVSHAEGRTRALTDALSVLAPIKDSLLAKDYALQLAGRLNQREADVLDRLAKLEPPRRFDDDRQQEGSEDSARAQASGVQQPQHLSQSELNRRRFERQFLCLCAQHPTVALEYVAVLAQTQWHEPIHAVLSESILGTLAENPQASPAQIVTAATISAPAAASVLSTPINSSASIDDTARFLSEELSIGDMEDSIAVMKSQIQSPSALRSEEYEIIFESIAGMQKTLNEMRKKHAVPPLA